MHAGKVRFRGVEREDELGKRLARNDGQEKLIRRCHRYRPANSLAVLVPAEQPALRRPPVGEPRLDHAAGEMMRRMEDEAGRGGRADDDSQFDDVELDDGRGAHRSAETEPEKPPAGEELHAPGPPRAAHALLWGLRRRADEAQLTQAIAAIARVDRRFGARFVELLLDVAEAGALAKNVLAFRGGGLPGELDCRAEESLGEEGRVDLRFDGSDLTLFVENKLYSGYGPEQVERYLRAVRRVPRAGRSALLAVTRAVPTYGEPQLDEDERWLGSVRWAHLTDGLRELPIADAQLAAQWRLLLDVLEKQGDLGMTRADAELIRAWARYRQGREHLCDLLDQVWPRTLDVIRTELGSKYRRKAPAAELVDIERKGKQRKVVIQRDQTRVFLGFCVPAVVKDSALQVQFSGFYGVPHFTVQAKPWEAQWRLEGGDRKLAAADEELRSHGWATNRTHDYWARVHEPDEYLDAEDVPTRLVELIAADVPLIARSGILDHDVELGLTKARGGPPRHRRRPEPV